MTPLADFAALTARLTIAARQLAEARVAEARLAQTRPAQRWRQAALLWPLFTKG